MIQKLVVRNSIAAMNTAACIQACGGGRALLYIQDPTEQSSVVGGAARIHAKSGGGGRQRNESYIGALDAQWARIKWR